MELHKNREWGDGGRTYQEGVEVDCRQWKSFRVAEVRYGGVKIEYRLRKIDKALPADVECGHCVSSFADGKAGGGPPVP